MIICGWSTWMRSFVHVGWWFKIFSSCPEHLMALPFLPRQIWYWSVWWWCKQIFLNDRTFSYHALRRSDEVRMWMEGRCHWSSHLASSLNVTKGTHQPQINSSICCASGPRFRVAAWRSACAEPLSKCTVGCDLARLAPGTHTPLAAPQTHGHQAEMCSVAGAGGASWPEGASSTRFIALLPISKVSQLRPVLLIADGDHP